MDIMDAVQNRVSVRGYKPDPVPKEVIKEILEASLRSPSAINTQPWEFTIVSGEMLNSIKLENIEKVKGSCPHSEDIPVEAYTGMYKQRQIDLAVELFKLMGIKREDKAKRVEWFHRGFRFFDAPAAIIISRDRALDGTWSMFDLGAISQTICLIALKYGLGTCIESQGIFYSDVIRKFADIPEAKRIVIGIAIGYPDWDFPANKIKSERADLEGISTWVGF